MTARNEQRKLRIDEDNLRIPEAANLPPDLKLGVANQVEGVDDVDIVDLSEARRIVFGEDSGLPINTDAYLPSRENATELPIPLYVIPKDNGVIDLNVEDKIIELVNRVDTDDQEEVINLTNRVDDESDVINLENPINAAGEDDVIHLVNRADDAEVVQLGPRMEDASQASDSVGSSMDDEVDVVDDVGKEPTVPEVTPARPDATMAIPKIAAETARDHAAEVKMNDCPVETITPETAPAVAKWYDRIFDRAVKALDASRAYFNPPKEPTAEVSQLREQRRKLHEESSKMFSTDKSIGHEARQDFVGTEINLAGKKYTVDSFVAQGAFGTTFIARDEKNVQRIVKITKPFDRSAMFYKDVTPTPDEEAKATEPRAAILEVAALHSLSKLKENNPGPALIDAQFVPHPDNKNQRLSVIVMEYVPGVSLTQFMAENQSEPLDVVEAVTQVVDKLLAAHTTGIVHSDIKPANVIVSKDTASGTISAKLIDFGAAVIQKLRVNPKEVNIGKGDQIIDFGQDGNSPKRAVPSRMDRVLGRTPAQKPVYAQEAGQLVSPSFVKENETATVFRDRYSLGRSIQAMVFGKEFRDPARMVERIKDLPYPKLQLARIAEQLTKSNPRERISLTQTRRLLGELKTTEQGIEQIQEQIPA